MSLRGALVLTLAVTSCDDLLVEDTDVPVVPPGPVTALELWEETAPSGRVRVIDLITISQLATTDRSFYAQTRGGGPRSGLRVELAGIIGGWPPAVGTPITVEGSWSTTRTSPRIVVSRIDDTRIMGEAEVPVAFPWTPGADLGASLITRPRVSITSAVDPSGRAQTDADLSLGGTFGLTPGYGTHGDLRGVVVGPDEVAIRDVEDWTGSFEGSGPVDITIADLLDGTLARGTPVRLEAALQITPWSTDGRWMVVQDTAGAGVWVDTEAWAVPETSRQGDRVVVEGEVRGVDAWRVRSWTAPTWSDIGEAPVISESPDILGALVMIEAKGLGPVQEDGSRTIASGHILTAHFVPLDSLVEGTALTGVVHGDGIAALPW